VLADPNKWQWMFKLPQADMLRYGASVAGALLVLLAGKYVVSRREGQNSQGAGKPSSHAA
jgi:hypothetical protein